MHEPTDLDEEAAACDFVDLFLADREQARARTLADYLARFPAHQDRIAREYLALTGAPSASDAAPDLASDEQIGPYRLLRRLGQGGQGVVYLAQDARLERRVALKVLSTVGSALSTVRTARLRREAQALARLDHPGICAIYEAALEGERPYLAMRYIEGDMLALLLTQARESSTLELPPRTPDTLSAWLAFFERAAEALHAAHEVGIVHRDVKPGNLMRTHAGQSVLPDFGLASDLESTTVSLTQSGELFGTLPYMAPELLLGHQFDRRVDVYALGVTLYECLTLRRPFEAATHAALRTAIESGQALPARELNAHLPKDLAIALATALERDRDRRYASAHAFAADLRRVRLGEPILARPIGLPLRMRRWIVRHPVFSVAFTLLVAGLLTTLVLLAQVVRGREQLLALREAYQAQTLSEEQPGLALHIAVEAAHKEPHPEINDILLQILDRCWEQRTISWRRFVGVKNADATPGLVIDPSSRFVVVGQYNGHAAVFAFDSGELVRTLAHADDGAIVVALCAAGKRVVTGGRDGCVQLWDLATGERLRGWSQHAPREGKHEAICCLAVASGGVRVASCGDDGVVGIQDIETESPAVRCLGHRGAVAFAAFDPSGERIVTLGDRPPNVTPGDLTARVFDSRTGALLATFGPFSGPVRFVAWSHDGERIVTANDDGQARVFALASRDQVASFSHGGQVNWAEFDPSDRFVVTGSTDGVVVWDVATGQRRCSHADFHERSAYRGRWSPDGTKLGVIGWDNTARLYDTHTWEQIRLLKGHGARPMALCWDPGGTRLATLGFGINVWYAADRPYLPTLRGHTGRVVSATFAPEGARVLTASTDATARVWDAVRGVQQRALTHDGPLRAARFARDGVRIVTACEGGPVRMFGAGDDAVALGAWGATDARFVCDDRRVVTLGNDGVVRLFDATTGALQQELSGHAGPIQCVALHPLRPWLATGGSDRTVRVWDLGQAKLVFAAPPWTPGGTGRLNERVFGLAFDARGERLSASCEDVNLRTWNLNDGWSLVVHPCGPTPGLVALAMDGSKLLVSAQWGKTVNIYTPQDLQAPAQGTTPLPLAPVQHSNLITSLCVHRGGSLALCASKDGTVSIFDVATLRLLSVIHASSAPLLDAQLSPDGSSVVTAAADGGVRIWPVDPLPVAERYRPERDAPITGLR